MVKSSAILKEEINSNKVRILAESFDTFSKTSEGVSVVGLALPFEKVSRNGFSYDTESIKNTFESLNGSPVLFNHNPDIVLGHVKSVQLSDEGLRYEMDLDEEEPIVKKMRRGDINKVSVQVMYDDKKSYIDDDTGVTHAYVNEFLELSIVTIPGFADTTAMLVESLQNKKDNTQISEDIKMSKEESKQTAKIQEGISKEEDKVENPKPSEEPEEQEESVSYEDKFSALEQRISQLEKSIEEMQPDEEEEPKKEESEDEEEKPESEDESAEEPEEDDEAKREEAIRKDKVNVSSELYTTKEEKTIKSRDLHSLFSQNIKY